MIFQVGINLDIPDKDIQATIDLDTGLIGFVEKAGDNTIEFAYQQSPPTYKKALFDVLFDKAVDKNYLNLKISRKSECAGVLSDFWNQQGD